MPNFRYSTLRVKIEQSLQKHASNASDRHESFYSEFGEN